MRTFQNRLQLSAGVLWLLAASGSAVFAANVRRGTVYPDADTTVVDGNNANTNYGQSADLMVKHGTTGFVKHAYLRFDLSRFKGDYTVVSAKVRLTYVTDDTKPRYGVSQSTHTAFFVPDDSWVESTVTWSNKPTPGQMLTSWTVPKPAGQKEEFDVTAAAKEAVEGDGKLSICISEGAQYGLVYASREHSNEGYRPALVLEVRELPKAPQQAAKPVEPPPATTAKKASSAEAQDVVTRPAEAQAVATVSTKKPGSMETPEAKPETAATPPTPDKPKPKDAEPKLTAADAAPTPVQPETQSEPRPASNPPPVKESAIRPARNMEEPGPTVSAVTPPPNNESDELAASDWRRKLFDLKADIQEKANQTATIEQVAKEFGVDLPPNRTTATPDEVKEKIQNAVSALVDEKYPVDTEKLKKEADELYKQWKVGDSVSFEKQFGSIRNVSGTVKQILPGQITVGTRLVRTADLNEETLAHFFPEKAEEMKKKYINTNSAPLRVQRSTYADNVRDGVSERLFKESGYTKLDGTWLTDKQTVAQLTKLARDRSSKFLPQMEKEVLTANGFELYQDEWLPSSMVRQKKQEQQELLAKKKAEREGRVAAALSQKKQSQSQPSTYRTGDARADGGAGGPLSMQDMAQSLIVIDVQTIGGDKAMGSGFLLSMDGKNYIITNQHVLSGGQRFRFRTLTDIPMEPTTFECAKELDLVRIGYEEAGEASSILPLRVSEVVPEFNEELFVYGNSAGANVATLLKGKVLGVGPDAVETDAKFIQGNSGSPVIDITGSVMGVATYATLEQPDWVTQGTRFTEVRRFALRITERTQWVPTTFGAYLKQTYLIKDINSFLIDLYPIMQLDTEVMENYKVERQRAKYHDETWCKRINALINEKGMLELMQKRAYPVEIKGLVPIISSKLQEEIATARNQLKAQKWLSRRLWDDAKELERMCTILTRKEEDWEKGMNKYLEGK